MPRKLFLALGALLVAAAASAAEPPIIIDGAFSDWGTSAPAATDPAGDARGAFDLTRVFVTSRDTVLYVRFDTGTVLNLQSGPERDGTLILRVGTADDLTLAIDVRRKTFSLLGGAQRRIGWSDVGYRAAPTYAAEEFEARIDLASLGARRGEPVTIDFAGSDALDSPIVHRLETAASTPTPRSPDREDRTDFRIVSLNTQRGGLIDPRRRDALGRLLAAAEADVITIQEEYETSPEQIRSALEQLVPAPRGRRGGGEWKVHKVFDCAIASRSGLVPVRSYDQCYAAALVEVGQEAVLVLSIHPKCCGNIGSEEDRRRIQQTRAMLRTVRDLRETPPDSPLAEHRDAPVVILGDWNLVGSRTPLDILTDPAEGGFTRRPLLSLPSDRVITWLDPGSPFSPGVLDLVVYDATRLSPRNGFVLDTRSTDAQTLRKLGLEQDDSAATDHLLLVADFAFGR